MTDLNAVCAAQLSRNVQDMGLSGKTKADKIDNTQLLADTGLSIVHVNNIGDDDKPRSMTIAYKGSDRLVEIATSVTHPQDRFCRKIGTKLAVENFQAGKKVRIAVPIFWQGQLNDFVKTLFAIA